MPVFKPPRVIFTMILLICMGIIAVYGLIREVSMLKFKFHWLNNTLATHQEGDI